MSARDLQSQNLVVENKIQKMEQKWAELLEKQLEIQMVNLVIKRIYCLRE